MESAAAVKDKRIEIALRAWAPRFVASGVPLADFEEVTRSLTHWDDWCARHLTFTHPARNRAMPLIWLMGLPLLLAAGLLACGHCRKDRFRRVRPAKTPRSAK